MIKVRSIVFAICSFILLSGGPPMVPSAEATIDSVIGHAKLRDLKKHGAIRKNYSAKRHRTPMQELKSTKAAKSTPPPAKNKVTKVTNDSTIKNYPVYAKSGKSPRAKSKTIKRARPNKATSVIRTPIPTPRSSSKPTPAEKNTYVYPFSATFPMTAGSIRRRLRRLASSYSALGEAMK
jgi:hypothetical protein